MTSVAEYLQGLNSTSGAAPIAVKIGRETYYGATYRDIVSDDWCMYLLGNLPASYKRSSHVVYTYCDASGRIDDHDWYVAGFADAAVTANPLFSSFHPFGAWFQLRQWPHQLGERIDEYNGRSYRRLRMKEVTR